MESNQPLVSVVIPAYNVEAYLDVCLRSVVEQDYKQLEILVVDDASTDRTLSIARHWAMLDSRIVVIEKSHEGLPMTRRRGLDASHGKYIQHLDGDDWLCAGAIAALVACAEESGAEVVYAPFYIASSMGDFRLSNQLKVKQISGFEHLGGMLDSSHYWTVWSHFMLRSFYYAAQVDVKPEVNMGEDGIMMVQLMAQNPRVAISTTPILFYRQNPASITNHPEQTASRNQDIRALMAWLDLFLRERGLTEHYQREIEARFCYFCCQVWGYRNCTHHDLRRMGNAWRCYPGLFHIYPSRLLRLVKVYARSQFLGDLRLISYRLQGKM